MSIISDDKDELEENVNELVLEDYVPCIMYCLPKFIDELMGYLNSSRDYCSSHGYYSRAATILSDRSEIRLLFESGN